MQHDDYRSHRTEGPMYQIFRTVLYTVHVIRTFFFLKTNNTALVTTGKHVSSKMAEKVPLLELRLTLQINFLPNGMLI